jgi:alkanesulfonate monooxygenase SsuD/methylene tetrahydromethanopterin reductase-like flavin-dependent oxidoreductase (luciferase family)
VRIGILVSCNGYRNPALLAKMAATVDVLSNGRLIHGVGAGWFADEYEGYGYDFPDVPTRLAQLDESLRVQKLLWTAERPSFDGRFYRLKEAWCEPRPAQRPHPPILIGGSGERVTLKLVARYADACNLQGPPRTLAQRLEALRRHCDEQGRDYGSIEKTCMVKFDLERRDPDVVVKTLRELAAIGIDRAFGPIKGVEWLPGLEIMARDVVPRITDL